MTCPSMIGNQTLVFAPGSIKFVQVLMCPQPAGPVTNWHWTLTIRDEADTVIFQTSDFTVVDDSGLVQTVITPEITIQFEPGEYEFDIWRTSPSPNQLVSGVCVVLDQQLTPEPSTG